MRDLATEADFAVEALEVLRVAANAVRKKLQRHRLPELRILGAVHLTHAAAAEKGDDPVAVGEHRARREMRFATRPRIRARKHGRGVIGRRCHVRAIVGLDSRRVRALERERDGDAVAQHSGEASPRRSIRERHALDQLHDAVAVTVRQRPSWIAGDRAYRRVALNRKSPVAGSRRVRGYEPDLQQHSVGVIFAKKIVVRAQVDRFRRVRSD
jgi:hypothetical protein